MIQWRDLDLDPQATYSPHQVISIIGGSRSGTTIIKYATCLHPDVTSLAGEEEPYYKLSRNGYPWDLSDEFHKVREPEAIRLMIANEVMNHASHYNRRLLQRGKVEEPPFVVPITCQATSMLVLKTPQNVYRRGVIEQLYPDAEIIYVKVTRDRRATINGLLDGWESGLFTARLTPEGWWCFDMPPNWSWNTTLLERCQNQQRMATNFMASDYGDCVTTVRFEDFEDDWRQVCRSLWSTLELRPYNPIYGVLPALSVTEKPEKARWRRRRPWLENLV